jgi:hypothetical protein
MRLGTAGLQKVGVGDIGVVVKVNGGGERRRTVSRWRKLGENPAGKARHRKEMNLAWLCTHLRAKGQCVR